MPDVTKNLGRRALEFAKRYVALTEALQSQGVPEAVARSEARATALLWLLTDDGDAPPEAP